MVGLTQLDAEDLALLLGWIERYYRFEGLRFDEAVRGAAEELLRNPGLGAAFEIRQGGTPIGYAVLTFAFDHEFGGRFGIVTDFFLEEAVRGRGWGRAALEQLMRWAQTQGLRAIDLVTLRHNESAPHFYAALGFERVTDRQSWFKPL